MKTPAPVWKGSLLLSGLLTALVMVVYFWQIRQLQQTYLERARADSVMLARVIESNARNTLLSQESIEKIIRIFLDNTARFLDYLDSVERFSSEELGEFAFENGIAGIRIIREDGPQSEGPPGRLPPHTPECGSGSGQLRHLSEEHLYLLTRPKSGGGGCILLGLSAIHIEKLQEQIGLPRLLESLSGLSGIRYVYMEKKGEQVSGTSPLPQSLLRKVEGENVAETRLPLGQDILVTGLDMQHYQRQTRQIWNEFLFFGAMLAFLGLLFSWLLHRSQTAYLLRIQEVERELARQREDAALGRAAATITHEIRNPLNAIGMGLQRLQMEKEDWDPEYSELLDTMLRAVQRSNGIVSNLRRFAGPVQVQKKKVRLDSVIANILGLYRQKCQDSGIDIHCEIQADAETEGDPHLLEQAVENLIKNSIEAQPEGGYIRIESGREGAEVFIRVENAGFHPAPGEAARITEPYYTTKTRGTGLGLAIVKKIISAHGGKMETEVPEAGILRIVLRFPAGKN